MSKQVIRVSDSTFRAIAAQHGFVVTEPQAQKQYQSPLAVGDTVRITAEEFAGQIGEITVIDQGFGSDADFYGVYLDSVEKEEFFWADEIERVENIDSAELPF